MLTGTEQSMLHVTTKGKTSILAHQTLVSLRPPQAKSKGKCFTECFTELHGIGVSFLTDLLGFQDPQKTTLLGRSSQPDHSKDSPVLQSLAGFLSNSKRQHRQMLDKEHEASLKLSGIKNGPILPKPLTPSRSSSRNLHGPSRTAAFENLIYPFTELFTEPSRTFTDSVFSKNLG